ncbi:unnamed protein product, partial [Vitis vinifera]
MSKTSCIHPHLTRSSTPFHLFQWYGKSESRILLLLTAYTHGAVTSIMVAPVVNFHCYLRNLWTPGAFQSPSQPSCHIP